MHFIDIFSYRIWSLIFCIRILIRHKPRGIYILRGLQPRPNRKSDSVGIMLLFMHSIGFSHSLR